METPIDFQKIYDYVYGNAELTALANVGDYQGITEILESRADFDNPEPPAQVRPLLSFQAVIQSILAADPTATDVIEQWKIKDFGAWMLTNTENPPGANAEEQAIIKAQLLNLFPVLQSRYSIEKSLLALITEIIDAQDGQAFSLLGNLLKDVGLLNQLVFDGLSNAINATIPDPNHPAKVSWVVAEKMTGVNAMTVSLSVQGLFNGFTS